MEDPIYCKFSLEIPFIGGISSWSYIGKNDIWK